MMQRERPMVATIDMYLPLAREYREIRAKRPSRAAQSPVVG